MRSFFLPLLALALTTAISFAEEITVTGILKQETHKQTQSEYFVIETAKPVSIGSVKASKLQIAGLDQKAWSNAAKLVGKKVSAKGMVGEPETRYHFTDLLLVTDKVEATK